MERHSIPSQDRKRKTTQSQGYSRICGRSHSSSIGSHVWDTQSGTLSQGHSVRKRKGMGRMTGPPRGLQVTWLQAKTDVQYAEKMAMTWTTAGPFASRLLRTDYSQSSGSSYATYAWCQDTSARLAATRLDVKPTGVEGITLLCCIMLIGIGYVRTTDEEAICCMVLGGLKISPGDKPPVTSKSLKHLMIKHSQTKGTGPDASRWRGSTGMILRKMRMGLNWQQMLESARMCPVHIMFRERR